MLIEMIFEINGYGLLGYYSIVDRDYPLVMGILVSRTGAHGGKHSVRLFRRAH